MRLAGTCGLMVLVCVMPLANGCGTSSDDQEGSSNKDGAKPLLVHVGGTMRPVMEELATRYEKKTGQKIEINSAGSGELLAHIESQKEGDFYVCHDPFLVLLMKKKLGVNGWVVAHITPVIVVKKTNPERIKGVKDLFEKKNLDVWLTDYDHSSLGWMLPTIFRKVGIDIEDVKKANHIKTSRKGSEVANRVKMGAADAAMCWNAVAHLRTPAVDVVEIPPEHLPTPGVDTVTTATSDKAYPLAPMKVTLATLTCSKQLAAATKFADFVASEEGAKAFREYGFTMIEGKQLYKDGKKIE